MTRAEPPQEPNAEAAQAYERFLEEARREPARFVKHDANAHDDAALFRLVDECGMQAYGLYWLLVELLTGRRDHAYDVASAAGWKKLYRDMGCLCEMDAAEIQSFIAALYKHALIDRAYFDEMKQVSIARVRRDAEAYAEAVAQKKLGAWRTNRRRLGA